MDSVLSENLAPTPPHPEAGSSSSRTTSTDYRQHSPGRSAQGDTTTTTPSLGRRHEPLRDRRIRRFHLRSRKGCSQCKIRKVRCDERKPICGACDKRDVAELCHFPQKAAASSSVSQLPSIINQTDQNIAATTLSNSVSAGPTFEAYSADLGHADVSNPTLRHESLSTHSGGNNAFPAWTAIAPMSHANMNPFSTAGSLFEIPQQPSTGTSEPANPKAMHLFSPNMAHDIHTLPDMSWIFGHDEGDSGIASRDAANDYSTGSFAPLDFGSGTVTPDSSFDLDTSKDQSTLAIAQQNPHPTDKDSSSYLLQKQRLDEPDGLLPFFPVMEQRHQFRHFFNHASHSLLVAPKPPAANPFLCHFSHLAFGAHADQRVAQDTFRYALLSLASIDMGIKMDLGSSPISDNAMYDISHEQRGESYTLLKAAAISGLWKDDHEAATLIIASVVALCFRDRLSGDQDWEQLLDVGVEVLTYFGGAGPFIASHPTADRRFLVEQIAIIDLIGSLTTMSSPKILTWDSDWFAAAHYATGQVGDHVQNVYGWTRGAVMYTARAMLLFGEARDIDCIKRAQPKPNHIQLSAIVQSRSIVLVQRVMDLIPQAQSIQQDAKASLRPEVITGVTCLTSSMEIFMRTMMLMENIATPIVNKLVETIFDLSEASIARGAYSGLLLPLNLVDGVVQDSSHNKSRAKAILTTLRGRYYVVPGYLEKMIKMDWASFADVQLNDVGNHLRQIGYYVLCV